MRLVISSTEIRAARERAGLTQEELGAALGVSLRTVGNWERGATVPRNREAALRRVLADHLDDGTGPTLTGASDAELVAEIARRLSVARSRERDGDGRDAAPTKRVARARPIGQKGRDRAG